MKNNDKDLSLNEAVFLLKLVLVQHIGEEHTFVNDILSPDLLVKMVNSRFAVTNLICQFICKIEQKNYTVQELVNDVAAQLGTLISELDAEDVMLDMEIWGE